MGPGTHLHKPCALPYSSVQNPPAASTLRERETSPLENFAGSSTSGSAPLENRTQFALTVQLLELQVGRGAPPPAAVRGPGSATPRAAAKWGGGGPGRRAPLCPGLVRTGSLRATGPHVTCSCAVWSATGGRGWSAG